MNNITKVTHMYAFHIDSTTLADGSWELIADSTTLARDHPRMGASHGHHDVFWALSAGTPMSRLASVPEACTPSNHL